jgi:hypothetical protein
VAIAKRNAERELARVTSIASGVIDAGKPISFWALAYRGRFKSRLKGLRPRNPPAWTARMFLQE